MMIVSSIHWLIIIFPVIFARHLIARRRRSTWPCLHATALRRCRGIGLIGLKRPTGAHGHGLIITLFGLVIVDIINIKNDWGKLYHIWSYMVLYN
jgi:hypothetical protein